MGLASFVRRIFSTEESAESIERNEDIYISFVDLGRLKGMIYKCRNGHYHVIINQRLSSEEQKRTYLHEIYHRFVGFEREREAERFARICLKTPKSKTRR